LTPTTKANKEKNKPLTSSINTDYEQPWTHRSYINPDASLMATIHFDLDGEALQQIIDIFINKHSLLVAQS
jgi:hypothetical protein